METQPPFLFLAWAYSMLPFNKRDFGWTLLGLGVAALLIAPFLPSLDRQEEAHAFFVSDGYVKGNGVLVGAEVDGELKLALLTCKHIVTEKMLSHGHSYVSCPDVREKIFLNVPHRGFCYWELAAIPSARWHLASDSRQDFAWLILSREEVRRIAPNGEISCFRLPKDGCDLDSDICPGYALFANDMGDASALSCYSVYSPVLGDPRDPREQWFSNLYISLPGLGSCLAVTTRRRLHGPLCIVGEDVETLDAGGRQVRRFQMVAAKGDGGPNSSGSPVLVSMEGKDKSLLAGVVVACNGTGIAFQTLDKILPELRESLR